MKKILSLFVLTMTCVLGFGQSTLYFEDFSGQAGKGASGQANGLPIIDLSGVTWSVDVSAATLTANNDFLRVQTVGGNAILEGRDLDGDAIWLSPSIAISGFTNVSFTMDVSESNGTAVDNLEDDDTVTVAYRIDGGAWTTAAINGSFSNDFDLTVSSTTGLSGSTLELRVTMANTSNAERHRIDNIAVTGVPCTAFALPFNEGFEGGTFPPACWSRYRGENGLGTVNDWTSSTLTANSGSTSAFVAFEAVSGGNAQDWLVTPAIDLGNAPTQLRFFAREQFTIDYNTTYSVKISQSSATAISSFTTLQTYTEAQLGNTFNAKTIDLSAYSGVVYLAFVMEQNDGDNWFLDDVSVVAIASCTTPQDVSNLSADYSNFSIDLQWAMSTCYDEVVVIGKAGSAVTATPSGNGSAYTADSVFGSGTEIATDEFVVYKGNGSSVAIDNVVFGNTYHFEVFTRKGSSWSAGVPLSIDLNYCAVNGTIAFDTSITLVDFGNISNATAQGSGYDDFTAQSTSIARGTSEDLSVQINTDGNFAVYSYAWIDWNQDGDFDDVGEQYDLGATFNNPDGATGNSPLTIFAPVDAALGDTRLRVLCQYYFGTVPTNGPCDGSTDGEIEDYTVTVLPAITYVYDDGWSPSDPNGVATLANPIQVIRGNAVISSATACESVVVNPAASLTINNGVTLDIANALDLESTSIAFSSLILDGSINGTINYRRHVNAASGSNTTTGQNDLISAPLQGQTFGDLIATNSNILSGSIGGNPAFLFGPFDASTNSYVNYTPANTSDPLIPGIGYRTGSTDNGNYIFSGSVASGDVEVSVTSGGASDWNLIGNPYPSYINVLSLINETTNRDRFNDNSAAIYGYDGNATDGWTIYNLATSNGLTFIAPGQGFFINAESSGIFRFTPSMRTVGTSDDFIAGRHAHSLQYLKLKLQRSTGNYHTDIYFNANASSDLDIGYDASVWNSTPEPFSIYSYLVDNDNGIAMALQALDSNALYNVTIPLGVNANGEEPLEFSILESTIPEGINVYLEDLVTETITLLNHESYFLTPDTDLNGKGRFYLRFMDSTLSAAETAFEALQIMTDHLNKQIVIKGAITSPTRFSLYDIQGRQVVSKILNTSGSTHTVAVGDLSIGVYVAQLQNDNQIKTQKVILN